MDYGEKQHFEDPRDNLNLENWGAERDTRNIGNRVVASSEAVKTLTESPAEELGQIVDLTPPPTIELENTPARQETPYNSEKLKTVLGDKFTASAMAEIHRAENELSQTGNISDFYDEISEMSKIATENWAA